MTPLIYSINVLFNADIDECKRSSNCLRGRCINNMGSYHCECQRGYMLVGGKECQGQCFQCEIFL